MYCVLSVIVPVYNVCQYLDRCLASIVQQNIDDMEIILVDDGSTDESGMMCDEWAKKDGRIRVIHQSNAGSGYARNSGLAIATGKYVAFIDSDDYIAVDAYKKVLDRIRDTDIDICYYGLQKEISNNSFVKIGSPPNQLIYQRQDILTRIFLEIVGPAGKIKNQFINMSACSALYSRKLLDEHGIQFLSVQNCGSEDMFFNLDICAVAKSIMIYPDWLYYYCNNDSSQSKSYKRDLFELTLRKFNMLQERLRRMDLYEIGNENCIRAFFNDIMHCFNQEVVHEKIQGKKDTVRKIQGICENEIVHSALSEYKIRIQKLPLSQYLLFTAVKLRQVRIVYFLAKVRYGESTRYTLLLISYLLSIGKRLAKRLKVRPIP